MATLLTNDFCRTGGFANGSVLISRRGCPLWAVLRGVSALSQRLLRSNSRFAGRALLLRRITVLVLFAEVYDGILAGGGGNKYR